MAVAGGVHSSIVTGLCMGGRGGRHGLACFRSLLLGVRCGALVRRENMASNGTLAISGMRTRGRVQEAW
jgi:hypothetical protein